MRSVGYLAIPLSFLSAFTSLAWPATDAPSGVDSPFALDLYEELHGSSGNLCLSPSSLSSSLTMTLEGARGRTRSQIAGVLHVDESQEDGAGAFVAAANDRQLLMANAMWGQIGLDLREEYLAAIRERYDAGFEQVDFANDTDRVRRSINDWTAEHTNQRIDELLVEGDLDSDAVLVLTNAVYFDGRWAVPFDESRTADAEFHPTAGPPVTVPFMKRTDRLAFASFEQLSALELPYEGERFSMVLLLPHDDQGLRDVEASLTPERLAGWLDGLAPTAVRVRLPRFTIETRFDLTETLRAMGMTDAFTGQADFSGMSSEQRMFISRVVQSVRIEIDESGTEGAAGSGVVIKKGPHPPEFVADRPFLFLIRDRSSGQVLFIGRVANPGRVVG